MLGPTLVIGAEAGLQVVNMALTGTLTLLAQPVPVTPTHWMHGGTAESGHKVVTGRLTAADLLV